MLFRSTLKLKNKKMNLKKIITIILIIFTMSNNSNAQEVDIQGGGTLTDWAHLKKYEQSNSKLKNINDPNRVAFKIEFNLITFGPGSIPGDQGKFNNRGMV